MLNLFRNKLVSAIVWVVVFACILQAAQLLALHPPINIYYTSPLLQGWLDALHQQVNYGLYISAGIVFLLCLVAAFSFNYIVNGNDLLYKQTFFPALFYFYYCHLFWQQTLLTPHFIASIFILLVVHKFLTLDPRSIKTTPFLDIGFFASCAWCISPDMLLFVPAILLALIFAGYLSIKTFLMLFTGFIIPIYFVAAGFFLADAWPDFLSLFYTPVFTIDFYRFQVDTYHLVILGFSVFILLISLVNLQANYFKNTIRVRRAQQMLFFFFISGLAVVLFSKAPVPQSVSVLALPLSVFISYYFLRNKKPFIRETLFAVFFIIIIIAVIIEYLADGRVL